MLLACPTCHLQYDAGAHEPGSKIRCFCGELITVGQPKARQVRMIHCSHCGGRLAEGATTCEYCSAEVALGDRGLGELCPECYARMVVDASYCSTCGIPIRPEQIVRALKDLECPRCTRVLSMCRVGERTYTECTSCGGLWLDAEVFERLSKERAQQAEAGYVPELPLPPQRPIAAAELDSKVRYVKCPVCKDMMVRKNFATSSGIIIDWCRQHGYWFDANELETILRFIDEGGVRDARRREEARRDAAKHMRRTARTPTLPMGERGGRLGDGWGSWLLIDFLVDGLVDLFD